MKKILIITFLSSIFFSCGTAVDTSAEIIKRLPDFPDIMDKASYALQLMAEGKLSIGLGNKKSYEIEQLRLKNFRNNLIIGFFSIVIVILLVFSEPSIHISSFSQPKKINVKTRKRRCLIIILNIFKITIFIINHNTLILITKTSKDLAKFHLDLEKKYGAHDYHPLPVVLEKGQIVESGNHNELSKLENGTYKKLSELQFQS